jgi:hypothetical protein
VYGKLGYSIGDIRYPANQEIHLSPVASGTYRSRAGINNSSKPYPNSVYSLTLTEGEAVGCTGKRRYLGFPIFGTDLYGGLSSLNWPPSPSVEDPTNKAFLQVVNAHRDTLQGLVFTGELKETMGLLRYALDLLLVQHNDVAQSLGKNLKKVQRMDAKGVAQVVSDAWLGYQFGILPLTSDIKAIGKSISAIIYIAERPIKISGSFSLDGNAVKKETNVGGGGLNQTVFMQLHRKRSVKLGTSYILDRPDASLPVAEAFGLTWGNFVPTAWQLLPYSWLVDYFAGISVVLDVLSYKRGTLQPGWSVTTDELIKESQHFVEIPDINEFGSPYITGVSPGFTYERTFSFNRDLFSFDAYLPSLEFRDPAVMQVANIAALAVNRVTKPLKLSLPLMKKR